jgi:hypothetical protein
MSEGLPKDLDKTLTNECFRLVLKFRKSTLQMLLMTGRSTHETSSSRLAKNRKTQQKKKLSCFSRPQEKNPEESKARCQRK